jgi:signal transduction histidine kinase
MTERSRGIRQSVFAKLVTIMLVMAASLLALVAGFFLLYISPALNESVDRLVREYARVVAASAPTYDTAMQLGARLDVQMRYEGPGGAWTTSADIPTLDEARGAGGHHPFSGHDYYLVPAPDGGTYLFAWTFTRRTMTAHLMVLALLLVLMVSVLFTTHALLRHLLRPLRSLAEGVARLSDGQLDVVVPNRSRDEFGALTDAFNTMVTRVKDMIHARDQLLRDVSHELRSPVTRLKVALALLPDGGRQTRMAADLAEMEMMIGELLELERLRDGHGIRTARQNLIPILDEVAANFHDRPPGVRVISPAPEVFLDIDPDRMQVVVRNLVENAVKYSLADSRPVELSVVQDEARVVVRVMDDGPGIPECDVQKVFEPFFRVDRSRSRKSGGYGLGLSISRRIVEAHGGTIAVENNAVRGASFVLTLPRPAA